MRDEQLPSRVCRWFAIRHQQELSEEESDGMRQGTCKHFTGAHHNECCAAGVKYMDVTPQPENLQGRALRLPCHTQPYPNASPSQMEHYRNRGTCEKYTEPTAEDLAEHERQCEAEMAKMMKSMSVIAKVKKEHAGESWNGVEACPVCGGTLHVTHAACNGHVWGTCETADCLAWME